MKSTRRICGGRADLKPYAYQISIFETCCRKHYMQLKYSDEEFLISVPVREISFQSAVLSLYYLVE